MSNRNNDQDLAEDFFTGAKQSSIASMKPKQRTKSEQDRINSNTKIFFFVVWALLAITTFAYGYWNLRSLFLTFIEWMPLDPTTLNQMAAWMGGILGIVILDGGYKLWGYVALYASETADQLAVARTAEGISFFGSAYFTASVIVTAFPSVVSPVLINLLNRAGVVIFVVAALTTMVASFLFLRWSMASQKQQADAKSKSEETTEIIDIYRTMKQNAVTQASNKVRQNLGDLSDELAESLAEEIKREMKAQIPGGKGKSEGKK